MAQRPSFTAAWLQPPCGHPSTSISLYTWWPRPPRAEHRRCAHSRRLGQALDMPPPAPAGTTWLRQMEGPAAVATEDQAQKDALIAYLREEVSETERRRLKRGSSRTLTRVP